MQKNMALIVVDVQNGFTPGGNLAVAGSDQIIPKINQLAIILTLLYSPKIGILKITFLLQTTIPINRSFKPLN